MHYFNKTFLSTLFLFIFITGLAASAHGGEWWTDPKTKCKLWKPDPVNTVYISHKGSCKNGIANGKGSLELSVDDKKTTVKGNFVNGSILDISKLYKNAAFPSLETISKEFDKRLQGFHLISLVGKHEIKKDSYRIIYNCYDSKGNFHTENDMIITRLDTSYWTMEVKNFSFDFLSILEK